MDELWNGFFLERFVFEGKDALIVFPSKENDNGYLAMKTEYWNGFPAAIEIDLLKQGFHLCFITSGDRWGSDDEIERKVRFIRFVEHKYGLQKKIVPVGMSCGGLMAIKIAAKYPELISCMYLDAPVMNYLSCPCGLGVGKPLHDGQVIPEILSALNMESVSQLLGYRDMPLDKIQQLIDNRIPFYMVAGGVDILVPYCENGAYLEAAYKKTNIDYAVTIKPNCNHNPHGLEDNHEVVEFILKHYNL